MWVLPFRCFDTGEEMGIGNRLVGKEDDRQFERLDVYGTKNISDSVKYAKERNIFLNPNYHSL